MPLSKAQQKRILRNKSLSPDEAFKKAVEGSAEFKKASELILKIYGIKLSLFDLSGVNFLSAGENGKGILLDLLHFVSLRQGSTAVKHGLRRRHKKKGGFVLGCRNLLISLHKALKKKDKSCPQTLEEFLSNVVMGNMSAACTPHNGAGKPYNAKKKEAISKSHKDYATWEKCVEDLLCVQLAAICELCLCYDVTVLAITLGGKGKRGARMKKLQRVVKMLSPEHKRLLSIGENAYKHPCQFLPSKARGRPTIEEMVEYKTIAIDALKAIGLVRPNLRITSIEVVETMWDREVSVFSFFSLFFCFDPPSS